MSNSRQDAALERIFQSVAKKVSATKQEAILEKAFAEKIKRKLQAAFGKKAQLFFVGSTARDTGISGDKDIDLFVAFPKEKSRDYIVSQTIKIVKKTLPTKWEMHYAEHPYLQGHLDGYKLEVVPCFKISVNEGIISAVDRTPLHATYLQDHLTIRQKRDVRVLKALLKANGIYGAELEVEGFSGLVCEYLVLNYRSLLNLLKAAAKWAPPVVLDIEDYYDQEYDDLKKKFQTPLIIIDFIDKNRNAAAAISQRSFSKFILLSRSLLYGPTEEYFSEMKIKYSEKNLIDALSSRKLILLQMKKPKNLISDILIPQLRRSQASLAKQLEISKFKVFNSHSFSDENCSYILLELEHTLAYPIEKILGPPAFMEKDAANFLSKHKNAIRGPYLENGRLVVEQKRLQTNAVGKISEILKTPREYGIASHFIAPFKECDILEKDNLLYAVRRNNVLAAKLAQYLFQNDL